MLAISILSGPRGQQQAKTKVRRILDFKKNLKQEFIKNSKLVYIQDNQSEKVIPTLALSIQRERVESSLRSCARALYFKEFNNKFLGDIQIFPLFLYDLEPKFNDVQESFFQNTKVLFSNIQGKGENPAIFTYKFITEESMNKILLEMNFYEDYRVIAIFKS